MESRRAKVVTFSMREALTALMTHAQKNGESFEGQFEHAKLEIDGQRNTVQCTYIFPITQAKKPPGVDA